eukprot:35447-Chlamydomonas_euryale.AAC.1
MRHADAHATVTPPPPWFAQASRDVARDEYLARSAKVSRRRTEESMYYRTQPKIWDAEVRRVVPNQAL